MACLCHSLFLHKSQFPLILFLQYPSFLMMKKSVFTASIFAVLLTFCMPSYAKNIFKNSEFLKWSEDNKSFYIRTSIGMAGLIAAQNDKKHARCIEGWYYSDEGIENEKIYKVMRKYPDHHPRGIIVAVLQKQCGSFNYLKK